MLSKVAIIFGTAKFSHWLVYDGPSSSRLGIANKFAQLSLRSVSWLLAIGYIKVSLRDSVYRV